MSPVHTDKLVSELADREAIRDCIMRYSRAIDRRDKDLLATVYWPGAYDHHGAIDAPAEEFIEQVIPAVQAMAQTMHSISNILIRLSGRAAAVESYFFAYHRVSGAGDVLNDVYLGGRYLDHMEKRGQEWRIEERTVMYDWFSDAPSADWAKGAFGLGFATHAMPDDPSYELFLNI